MKDKEIQIGQIVCSTQGRDKDEFYVVISKDAKFAYLGNGTTKLLTNLKKKNQVHLKATCVINTEIAKKLENKQKINDQMIYHSIYEYKKGLKGSK